MYSDPYFFDKIRKLIFLETVPSISEVAGILLKLNIFVILKCFHWFQQSFLKVLKIVKACCLVPFALVPKKSYLYAMTEYSCNGDTF